MIPSSAASLVVPLGDRSDDRHHRVALIRTSTIVDGDFHLDVPRAALQHRQRSFMTGIWTQLDEVHGTVVRRVTRPGEHDRAEGDALVTDVPGVVLGVWVGDCAPIVITSTTGVLGAAHVGWRGALDGVVGAVVGEMRDAGADEMTAYLGPCIHACCYEFGEIDLERLVGRFGREVAARTAWGSAALDMRATVRAACAEHSIDLIEPPAMSECTGCNPQRYFSHRRRGERSRQVMAARIMVSG